MFIITHFNYREWCTLYTCLKRGCVVENVPPIYQSMQLSMKFKFAVVVNMKIRFCSSSLSRRRKFSPFVVLANTPSIFNSAKLIGCFRPSFMILDIVRCIVRDIWRTFGSAAVEIWLLILTTPFATTRFDGSCDVCANSRISASTNLACSLRLSGACVWHLACSHVDGQGNADCSI